MDFLKRYGAGLVMVAGIFAFTGWASSIPVGQSAYASIVANDDGAGEDGEDSADDSDAEGSREEMGREAEKAPNL